MKPLNLLAILGAAGLAGCASVPLPPEAAKVALVAAPSNSVGVYPPKLVFHDGKIALTGRVFKQLGAWTTRRTHLDVEFLDTSGNKLRNDTVHFVPPEIQARTSRSNPSDSYALAVAVLPTGTATIQVKAHDQPHS